MKKSKITLVALALNAACMAGAYATPYDLAEVATNRDGVYFQTLYNPNQNLDFSGGPYHFSLSFSGAGSHKAIGFVDPEIDQSTNGWWNEYGSTTGTLAAGQSWEIDEPGYVSGNIVDNGAGLGNHVQSGTLDNINSVPQVSPDDVSMAIGWDFLLSAGQTATVDYYLTDVLPTSFGGFYITQTDPDSLLNLYYYSTLTIQGGQVPEPPILALLGIGMAGLLAGRRKQTKV